MSARNDRLEDDLHRLTTELVELRHHAQLMHTVFITKEPDAVRAAEAYDGLRKQVIASNGERRAHLAQLVEMAVATQRAQSVADIAARVGEWLNQAGIVTLAEVPPNAAHRREDLFEVLGEVNGELVVTEPVYIDATTGAVLRRGRMLPADAAGVDASPPAIDVAPDGTPT